MSHNPNSGGGTSKSKAALKGPVYAVPPRIIGESVRLRGRTLGEIGALILGLLLALAYMVFVPFPDVFSIKLVIGVVIFIGVLSYFIVPYKGLTAADWTIVVINFRLTNIPRRTRARPSLAYSRSRSRYMILNPTVSPTSPATATPDLPSIGDEG